MDYEIIEKRVPSVDGIHALYGKLYVPSGEIKGYFHLVHGMTEHIGRYDELLKTLASFGYLAFAFDNLGHGRTVNDKSELGFISHKNGWKLLCEDLNLFYKAVKDEYGDKPYYLYGHSMGSFIVRVAVGFTVEPEKVILSGTGGKNNLAGLGIALIKFLKAFKGDRHVSKFFDKIVFGSYNKKFENEGSKRSWLTSDASVRARYDADELCAYRFGLSALSDLITLNKIANSKKRYKTYPKTKTLLVSGKDDPVGKFGAGVLEVYNNFKKAGVPAEVKLYSGRHEVHNEPLIKDEVIKDIINFIEK